MNRGCSPGGPRPGSPLPLSRAPGEGPGVRAGGGRGRAKYSPGFRIRTTSCDGPRTLANQAGRATGTASAPDVSPPASGLEESVAGHRSTHAASSAPNPLRRRPHFRQWPSWAGPQPIVSLPSRPSSPRTPRRAAGPRRLRPTIRWGGLEHHRHLWSSGEGWDRQSSPSNRRSPRRRAPRPRPSTRGSGFPGRAGNTAGRRSWNPPKHRGLRGAESAPLARARLRGGALGARVPRWRPRSVRRRPYRSGAGGNERSSAPALIG